MLGLTYKYYHPDRPLLHQLFFLCHLFPPHGPINLIPFLWDPLPPASSGLSRDLLHLKEVATLYNSLLFVMRTSPNCAPGGAIRIHFIPNTFVIDASRVTRRKSDACESAFQVRVIKFTLSSFVYLYRTGPYAPSCLTG